MFEERVEPNVNELIDIIVNKGTGKRVHFIELFLDEEIKEMVCRRYGIGASINPNAPFAALQKDIELYQFLGYDIFWVAGHHKDVFSFDMISTEDTTTEEKQARDNREWMNEHVGIIQTWEDYEKYKWPRIADVDFGMFEWMDRNLPENMGCYDLTSHILEIVLYLFGYEAMCYKLFDEPLLVDAVFEKVGQFYVDYTRSLCDFSSVKIIWGSDDLGFKTGTLISANDIRTKVLPWHKKCAQIAHEHNRPYLLHSCGNLDEIMDDLIETVKIDGRHSYEDAIMPVTDFKKQYGNRVAVLGGIDIDFLCRADEKAIRRRVRNTLEQCIPSGGYCLGTGNTVANYIPVNNYLTMLDEGRRFQF